MRVLEEYNKSNYKELTYEGTPVAKIMNNFFKNNSLVEGFRENARKMYDKNLESVQIYKVDEMMNNSSGTYFTDKNILLFRAYYSLIHELMHMSSTDRGKKRMAMIDDTILFEEALVEGMTEYAAMKACGLQLPSDYFFETFCVSMVNSSVPRLYESFFVPDKDKFYGLFPRKTDILSLMYALDYYASCHERDTSDGIFAPEKLEHAIMHSFDSLIDIELSMEKDSSKLKKYQRKFLELLDDTALEDVLGDCFPDYKDYAMHEVKKKILIKR